MDYVTVNLEFFSNVMFITNKNEQYKSNVQFITKLSFNCDISLFLSLEFQKRMQLVIPHFFIRKTIFHSLQIFCIRINKI